MKKGFLIGFSVFAIVGILWALFPQDSQAIPPFARKYKTACTTCHWGTFPRLNAFGKAFHANGLRMPGGGDEVFIKDEPVAMGASAWSRLFPKAVWPGEIPGLPPLGILSKFSFDILRERPQDFRGGDGGSPQRSFDSEFSGFDDLEVLVGATFGETLSFFAAGMWGETERAYLNYAPFLFGEQGLVNVRIGKLDIRGNPVSNHLKQIRKRNYLMNEMPVIPAGNLFGWHPGQNGIEFWGSKNGPGGKGGLEWAVGIVNGSMGDGEGHLVGDGDAGTIAGNVMEVGGIDLFTEANNGKDYYLAVSYKIGGMGVLGEESVDDSLVAKENWQDDSIKIKGYYYGGTTGAFISADGVSEGNPLVGDLSVDGPASSLWVDDANHFKRFGIVVTANWWNFEFLGAASFMEDEITGEIVYAVDGSLPAESGDGFDTSIYTGEVNWVALPWLIPSFRIENVNPDYDVRDMKSFTRYTFETRVITRANINVNIGGCLSNYMDSNSGNVPKYDLKQAADDAFWIQTEVAF